MQQRLLEICHYFFRVIKKKKFCIIGDEPVVMQIFVMGIDGSVVMQNCPDRMGYIMG